MANLGTGEGSSRNSFLDVADVSCKRIRAGANIRTGGDTLRRVTIQILAADGNSIDDTGQLVAILLNRSCEREKLVGERSITGRGPETEQQRRASFYTSRDC